MPAPFSWPAQTKIRLTSDFRSFHPAFYELDEAFGQHSGGP
jgi:hypothetical protein